SFSHRSQPASSNASTAASGSSMACASRIARISGPPAQRRLSASSTPSFEPNRVNTVARETPARRARSSIVAVWKASSSTRSAAAARTRCFVCAEEVDPRTDAYGLGDMREKLANGSDCWYSRPVQTLSLIEGGESHAEVIQDDSGAERHRPGLRGALRTARR